MQKGLISYSKSITAKKNSGHIFIITNHGYPGVVKIGKTTQEPDIMAAELTDCLSSPYRFVVAGSIFLENDFQEIQRQIYEQLKEFQIHEESTFFQMSASSAIQKVGGIISGFLACPPKGSKYREW